MFIHSLFFGGLLLGVDVGWQPLPDGEGMEYIIQLSPNDLEALKLGEPWMTDIPPSVGDVRAYRIVIGEGALPRVDPPPKLPALPADAPDGQPAPRPIDPELKLRPLPERQAVYMSARQGEGEGVVDSEETPSTASGGEVGTPPRPWMLLVGTALALAGSLGGNAYLLWGMREAHRRYQNLAAGLSSEAEA